MRRVVFFSLLGALATGRVVRAKRGPGGSFVAALPQPLAACGIEDEQMILGQGDADGVTLFAIEILRCLDGELLAFRFDRDQRVIADQFGCVDPARQGAASGRDHAAILRPEAENGLVAATGDLSLIHI